MTKFHESHNIINKYRNNIDITFITNSQYCETIICYHLINILLNKQYSQK